MAEDTAELLRNRCKDLRSLKDMGVDPALHAVRQHATSSTRVLHALAQLAQYKLAVPRYDDEELRREVCAALEARRATLDIGYDALKHAHPLYTQEGYVETDCDGLLSRLAGDAESARSRFEMRKCEIPKLQELAKLPEEEWREAAVARDQALQDKVYLEELRVEGLRAKQRSLERLLTMCEVSAEPPALPAIEAVDEGLAEPDSTGESPLLKTSAELVRSVKDMQKVCNGEVLAELAAIAARVTAEREDKKQSVQRNLQLVSALLRTARVELEPWAALHRRRCAAEALITTLAGLQAQVRDARKEERSVARDLEDLVEETGPGDPALHRATSKLEKAKQATASLTLRRDGLVAEVVSLSARQDAACSSAFDDTLFDDAEIELEFPDLPVRAQRIVSPFKAYEALDAAGRARFDVEVMLRAAGLLASGREYASYADLSVVVTTKPNVKRATLRGSAHGAALKILKEFGVEEFKRIKRAVSVAGRVRHPGIVPVECAFLELGGSVVVVQSPLFAGGNMRQWSRGKDGETRLRAAQQVAEAVRFLHSRSPPILHRDLKPENVVFDSDGSAATPALCDFDLSISAHDTAQSSTLMVGTLLYLSPDPAPSPSSDVFSLGMTLLDVILCGADEHAFRQCVLGSARGPVEADSLERVHQELSTRSDDVEIAALVRSMLQHDPKARPDASIVAETLGTMLNVKTCCVCHCPEPRDAGLECAAQSKHFACDECFSLYVARLEALCEDGTSGLVRCCMAGCAATFSLQEAGSHVSKLAFETLCRHLDDARHVALQGEFQEWKQRFQADFAAKSEHDRRVLAARQHIEELMDLRCPRCRRVFGQFTGCAALTCAYAGCNANFCAFCLADCGGDAHPHVRTCRLNPTQNEYFVSEAAWARVIDGERREQVQAYWAGLEPDAKEALAVDGSVKQILRDLRLDMLLGAATFASEVAQLRGMGFVDESAMRGALGAVGGDVAAALELLYAAAE